MKISKGEFCQLSLLGRIRLLHQYARHICSKTFDTKKITIFKLYDFYVAVIKDLIKNIIIEANPVVSLELPNFYLSL